MASCMKATINDGSVPQENLAMVTLQMQNNSFPTCAQVSHPTIMPGTLTFMIKVIGTKGATRYSYRDWVENTPALVHSQTYSAYPYTILLDGTALSGGSHRKRRRALSSLDDAITCMKIIEACEQSVEEQAHVTPLRFDPKGKTRNERDHRNLAGRPSSGSRYL